jgi:molybdopterin converting factor small subunit
VNKKLSTYSILAFGIARDIVGGSQFEIELEDSSTLNDLKLELLKRYPRFGELLDFSIALNSEYTRGNADINPSDELAIIPPVSGG